MKKRIVAFILMLTMVLTLVSCGKKEKPSSTEPKKEATVSQVFDKMKGLKAKTADVTMDMDLAGIKDNTTGLKKIGIKLSSTSDGDEAGTSSATIAYRLDDASEYTPLTSIIYKDKVLYVDYGSLKKAVTEFVTSQSLTQYQAVLTYLPDANYIKIDEATAKQFASEYMSEKNVSQPDKVDEDILLEVVRVGTEYVVNTLQDATKDVNPAIMTVEENGLKVTVTKDNASAASDAVLALDLNAKYDELVQKVKEVQGADQYASELAKSKDKVVSGVKETLTTNKGELDKFNAFNIDGEITVAGETGKREAKESISINLDNGKDKLVCSMSMTCKEEAKAEQKVEVPKDAMDVASFVQQISTLFQK